MAGVFQGAGNWRLDFITDGVLVNCSFLSPNQETYSVQFKNGQALVVVNTTPKPLVLTLTAAGNLVAPGPVEIDGVIATGYHEGPTNAMYKDVAGNLYDSNGNKAFQGAGYSTFSPKRTTCPALNLSTKGASVGIETMQTDVLKMAFGGDKGPPTPPGLRMRGVYNAKTGFSVEFYPESAIVACGEPARAYPYEVVANGSRTAVKIEDPSHPLLLNFEAGGALDPGTRLISRARAKNHLAKTMTAISPLRRWRRLAIWIFWSRALPQPQLLPPRAPRPVPATRQNSPPVRPWLSPASPPAMQFCRFTPAFPMPPIRMRSPTRLSSFSAILSPTFSLIPAFRCRRARCRKWPSPLLATSVPPTAKQ